MASGIRGRYRRWAVVAVAMAAAFSLVSGCGGAQYIYVANSDEKTYFKIPSGWHEIDQTAIDDYFNPENPDSAGAQLRKQLRWSAAYDAADDPTPAHMITAVTSDAPVLYVTVRHLTQSEQSQVSYDFLRDAFTYVTVTGRRQAASAGYDLSSFELLYDEILPAGEQGLHGVRVVFNLELPTGVVHTFDQTAWANADSSVIYLLLIRCTARCYRERVVEIDDVATSFTVRSKA